MFRTLYCQKHSNIFNNDKINTNFQLNLQEIKFSGNYINTPEKNGRNNIISNIISSNSSFDDILSYCFSSNGVQKLKNKNLLKKPIISNLYYHDFKVQKKIGINHKINELNNNNYNDKGIYFRNAENNYIIKNNNGDIEKTVASGKLRKSSILKMFNPKSFDDNSNNNTKMFKLAKKNCGSFFEKKLF